MIKVRSVWSSIDQDLFFIIEENVKWDIVYDKMERNEDKVSQIVFHLKYHSRSRRL